MTATLIPTTADLEKQVRDGSIDLNTLMTALAKAEAEQAQAEAEEPAPKPKATGKALALTENTRVVLRTIPTELANVTLPGAPKLLTDDESKQLIPLFENL